MSVVTKLIDILKVKKVFARKRKKMRTRALGILLYHYGLSFRNCKDILSSIENVSYEAIRKWYKKAEKIFSIKIQKRKAIAIDETKIKIHSKWHFLWAAIDITNWEILGIWVTQGRSFIEARTFLRYILEKCKNKPKIYVDRGPWYKHALNRLRVDWEHKTFGPRNPIEQWFGILKQRIKRFYKRWPHNASIISAQLWVNSFVTLYNFNKS